LYRRAPDARAGEASTADAPASAAVVTRRHDDAPASREASRPMKIASRNAQIESPLSGANLKLFSL
jgi:hypothetical protein